MYISPDEVIANHFDWKQLIKVYLAATTPELFGQAFYRDLLDRLEREFEIKVDGSDNKSKNTGAFEVLLRSTVTSYHAGTFPGANFLESGLIHAELEAAGDLGANIDRIWRGIHDNYEQRQNLHIEMIHALFLLIHGEPTKNVALEELIPITF